MAAADARSFSTGIENARYEGPLKLEIPIPLEVSEQVASLSTLMCPVSKNHVSKPKSANFRIKCHLLVDNQHISRAL